LSATQLSALASLANGNDSADFLNFCVAIALESGSVYRVRTKLLGDIVGARRQAAQHTSARPTPAMPHSAGKFVAPDHGHVDANDGMLHALTGR
jgi:Tfp pilus tip-associated adhesin PilY1